MNVIEGKANSSDLKDDYHTLIYQVNSYSGQVQELLLFFSREYEVTWILPPPSHICFIARIYWGVCEGKG
jgi:hypothetical protein